MWSAEPSQTIGAAAAAPANPQVHPRAKRPPPPAQSQSERLLATASAKGSLLSLLRISRILVIVCLLYYVPSSFFPGYLYTIVCPRFLGAPGLPFQIIYTLVVDYLGWL